MKRSSWDGASGPQCPVVGRTPKPGGGGNPCKKPPKSNGNTTAMPSEKSKRQKQALISQWAVSSTPKVIVKQSETPGSDGGESGEGAAWPSTAQRKLEKFGIKEPDSEVPCASLPKRSSSRLSSDSFVDPEDFQLFSQPEYTRQSQDTPAVCGKDHWLSTSQDDVFGWGSCTQALGGRRQMSLSHPGDSQNMDESFITRSQASFSYSGEAELLPSVSLSAMLPPSLSFSGPSFNGPARAGGGSPYLRAAAANNAAPTRPFSFSCSTQGEARQGEENRDTVGEEQLGTQTMFTLQPIHAPRPLLGEHIYGGSQAATPELSQPEELGLDTPNGDLGVGSTTGSGAGRACARQTRRMERSMLFPMMRPVQNNKTLCIIRHGESTFNKADQESKKFHDPRIFDPRLTDLGHQQTSALKPMLISHIEKYGDPLWAVSPLTRTIQSFLNACPMALGALDVSGGIKAISADASEENTAPARVSSRKASVELLPLISEYMVTAGDVGRPTSELALDYPQLAPQLKQIPEEWWYQDKKLPNCATRKQFGSAENKDMQKARLAEFGRWLGTRPEQFIVLVGHCSFWSSFLPDKRKMYNGELILTKCPQPVSVLGPESLGELFLFLSAAKLFLGARNLFLSAGNLFLSAGNLFLGAGKLFLSAGKLFLGAGKLILSAGNRFLGAGNLFLSAGKLFLGAGKMILSDGNLFLEVVLLQAVSEVVLQQAVSEVVLQQFSNAYSPMLQDSSFIVSPSG
eukprot:gene14641-20677_t